MRQLVYLFYLYNRDETIISILFYIYNGDETILVFLFYIYNGDIVYIISITVMRQLRVFVLYQ